MLEGIHILSETTKYTFGLGDLIAGIILVCISLFFLLCLIFAFINNGYDNSMIVLFIVILLFGFGSYYCLNLYATRTSYSEYKVIINDNVKLKEFENKYKILKQEGKIYTIIEKKN